MRASLIFLTFLSSPLIAEIPLEEIAQKIWHNECKGSIDGLVSWNQGEEFPSLGIGHFIWYPSHTQGPFQETFPALLAYLKEQGISLPAWLLSAQGCPWKTREEFLKHKHSPQTEELRSLLAQTITLQAQFILKRFETAASTLTHNLSGEKQAHIKQQFNRVLKAPNGQYALIDYLNFKGDGTNPKERYQGHGWGLLQVLELMPGTSDPIQELITAAKAVLTRRVEHSPPERDEQRWLRGWCNRLDTYALKSTEIKTFSPGQ